MSVCELVKRLVHGNESESGRKGHVALDASDMDSVERAMKTQLCNVFRKL